MGNQQLLIDDQLMQSKTQQDNHMVSNDIIYTM